MHDLPIHRHWRTFITSFGKEEECQDHSESAEDYECPVEPAPSRIGYQVRDGNCEDCVDEVLSAPVDAEPKTAFVKEGDISDDEWEDGFCGAGCKALHYAHGHVGLEGCADCCADCAAEKEESAA